MKIAIINMTNGGISGGYKKYLLNILPRLASDSNIESLLCISPRSLRLASWFGSINNVEFVDCSPLDFIKHRFGRKLKQKLEQFSPDLVFIPVARSGDFGDVPVLNMVQNIFPFLYQEVQGVSIVDKMRFIMQYFVSIKALRRAKRIVVTTKYIKEYLINKIGIAEGKVALIYFGKDLDTKNIARPNGMPEGWGGEFLFTAGSIESYRGIEDIIGAARYLKKDFLDLKIVIAGKARSSTLRYHRKLLRLCNSYNLTNNIFWAGQLNQAELAWCYQNCAVFIMTSRMETFGMIALEAMTNGCLCIAADNPPLPEIFLDSAYYYHPKDYRSLAEAINKVLALDSEIKLELKNKAKNRAGYFSWDNAAADLITEFKATIKC